MCHYKKAMRTNYHHFAETHKSVHCVINLSSREEQTCEWIKICFSVQLPSTVTWALCAVIYSHALPHYVPQLFERQILLPRCLSRSFSVCSSWAKVTRAAAGSLQPWAANWPGNVCSPVPPPTCPSVNQPDTEQGLPLNVPACCHLDIRSLRRM